MENLRINLTIGAAGTGKSYQIIQKINNEKLKNFVILSPTHSSLRNLMNSLNPEFHNKCSTVYSYFKINYEDEKVIGPSIIYNDIFIDEIGLIKKELFKKIIKSLLKEINLIKIKNDFNVKINLHLFGDPIQLSPIYTDKRKISFKKLAKYDGIGLSYLIEHDYNSPFSLSLLNDVPRNILKKNYRSNESILNLIHEIFYEKNIENIKFISLTQTVNHILKEGYIFISSKYDIQKSVYQLIKLQLKNKLDNYIEINDLMLYNEARFMVAETYNNFKNGEYLICEINDKNVYLNNENGKIDYSSDSKIKLLPEFLLTAHKSQGLSIKNIIVCVDELFDICMLYTMCTRARENIYFYSSDISKSIENIKINLDKFQEIMKFYKYI